MKIVFSIALGSLREALREKVLYSLVFFAVLLIVLAFLMGEWSILERNKVVIDFCLGALSLFGLFTAIGIGLILWHREFARKTVYIVVTKPLSRITFLLGKFLGLALVLFISLFLMSVLLLLALYSMEISFPLPLLGALWGLYLEMLVLAAAALMFATFSSPFLSAFFTLGLYIAGHMTADIMQIIKSLELQAQVIPGAVPLPHWVQQIVQVMYLLLPNLEAMNFRLQAVYQGGVSGAYLFAITGHALSYCMLCLLIAGMWFKQRDL